MQEVPQSHFHGSHPNRDVEILSNQTCLLPLSALVPVRCGNCFCFFDTVTNENVFNCSHTSLASLPIIPKNTNIFIFTRSNISTIPQNFIKDIIVHSSLTEIDLRHNKIHEIQQPIQLNLTNIKKFLISGNPFDCGCEMTWMIQLLNNFSDVITDFQQVKCGAGRFKGIPIHTLSDVALGCYPHNWTLNQKIAVASGFVVICILFVIVTLVVKKSREVKFLMYYYLRLNTLPKDDRAENLQDKEYDAFLCYR